MMTRINRSTITTLIIACLLFCSNIYCLGHTQAVTTTSTSLAPSPTKVFKNIVINELDTKHERFDLEEDDDDDDNKKDRKKKIGRKDKKDEDDDDKKDARKYSKHETKSESDGDSDDDDDENSKPTPSNTVVTTIIIVSTETPTTIYTGQNNPAKQMGTGGDASHQVSDPNSSSTSNTSSSNDRDEPSETQITAQLVQDQSAYHKLVLALSIVGGVAGIALLTGGFIFARMRVRKRKRKQASDLEMAEAATTPTIQSPPPPPPAHYRPPPPPPNARFSTMLEDGDTTVIDFSQNPFLDPAMTLVDGKVNKPLDDRITVSPTAPPALPVHLEPRHYANYRQNQTLSMISQTTATVLPSAPTAKELDVMMTPTRYENPFEEEYGSGHRQQSAVLEENEEDLSIASPSPVPSQAPSQTTQQSFSSDLPPPPAYTPSAAPSAPPLYALPTNGTFIESQEEDNPSARRHSISSCSIVSSIRPLSLRRGSGTLAHISSPFS